MALLDSLSFRIRRGPLQGARWTLGGGGKLLRLWQGSYEPEQTGLFCQEVEEGAVVFDIGAHAGYYSLLGSRRAGPGGRVVAFEAFPENAAALRRHLALNRCENVRVEEVAVAGAAGERTFRPGKGSGTGGLFDAEPGSGPMEGEFTVPAVDLDGWSAEAKLSPTVMKIDVEGAEAEVLEGAARILAKERPTIFLSLHGPAPRRDCQRILEAHGYRLRPILGEAIETSDEWLCEAGEVPPGG